MIHSKAVTGSTAKLLAGLLAGSFAFSPSYAQTPAAQPEAASGQHAVHEQATAAAPADKLALAAPASMARSRAPDFHPAREGMFYQRNWGVEIIGVHPVSSGYMLTFSYRILDPQKAKLLNDRKAKAYVIDEATDTRLAVPAMEKVGELRPDATPKAGRNYFMMFGNPGKLVKRGSRISVVVGNFRVDGLVVN